MDIAVLIPLLALISGALGVFISWITLNRKQKKGSRARGRDPRRNGVRYRLYQSGRLVYRPV